MPDELVDMMTQWGLHFIHQKMQDSFNLASLHGIYDIYPVRKFIVDVVQSPMLAEGFTRLQRVLVTQRSHFVVAM